MFYLLMVPFVVAYTTHQAAGFVWAAVGVGAVFLTRGLFGLHLEINRKDVLYAIYAAAALIPAIRFWDPYDFTFYLRVVLYPWAVSLLFQNVKIDFHRFAIWAWLMIAVILVTVGWMLFQVAPGEFDISLNRLLTLDRSRGFFYRGEEPTGPNAAAAMCVAGIAITLSLIKFGRVGPLIGLGLLAVLTVLLVVAGGRIAMAGAVALGVLYAVTRFGRFRLRDVLGTGTVLIVLGLVGATMYRVLASTHGEAIEARAEGIANPLEDHNLLVRLVEWARAWEMIEDEPWGSGYNAYYAVYERTPHNEVLGQWIGGGWLGALLYLVLVGYLTARSSVHVLLRLEPNLQSLTHYCALSMLGITWLTMLTEHVSRGGMTTFYPIVWMAVGLSYAAEWPTLRQAE